MITIFGEIPIITEYEKKRASFKLNSTNKLIKDTFHEVSARLEVMCKLKYDSLKTEKRTIENTEATGKQSFKATIQNPIYLDIIKKITVLKSLISTLF